MLNTLIKEIKELFADKKIWLGILTVLIIIIIGTSYNRKKEEEALSEHLRLGVINNDDSTYSELLLSYFRGSETFSSFITVTIGEEEEVKRAFEEGELDIYIEIPKGFAQNMIEIKHLPINVTINIKDTTKAILFQNVLLSYEKFISAVEVNAVGLYEIMELEGADRELIDDTNVSASLELIFTALGKEEFFNFKEVATFPKTRISEYYLISILIMSLMYIGLYAGFKLLREVRQGTFLRIRTTRMHLYQFLLAKLLFLAAALSAAATAAVCIICGSRPSMEIGLFSACVACFCVTMPMLLSAFFETTQRFMLVGNLLIFYFVVIGGGIIPIMFLPQDILRLSRITPFYYMMEGIIRINQGQPEYAVKFSYALLLAAFLFFSFTLIFFTRRRMSYEEA